MSNFNHLWKLSLMSDLPDTLPLLVIFIEALQRFSLAFPNHGWNVLTYKETYLLNLKALTGFLILELEDSPSSNELEKAFEWLTIVLTLNILIYIIFINYWPQGLIYQCNAIIGLSMRLLKLPCYNILLYEINQNDQTYKIAELGALIVIQILLIYFQRNVSYRKQNQVLYFDKYYLKTYLISILEILIIYLLNSNNSDNTIIMFIYFFLLFVMNFLKIKQTQKQDYNWRQIFTKIYVLEWFLETIILFFIFLKLNEEILFQTLLILGTCGFYVIQTIIEIQKNEIWNKQQFQNQQENYVDLEQSDNLIIMMDYHFQLKQYYKCLYVYYRYFNQENSTLFQRMYTKQLLHLVRKNVKETCNTNKKITKLLQNLSLSNQFKQQVCNFVNQQQIYFFNLIERVNDIYEIENQLIGLADQIFSIQNFMNNNKIFDDFSCLLNLKMSYIYYTQIIQDSTQAEIYKKEYMKQFLHSNSIDLQLSCQEALLLKVNFLQNGIITNSSNKLNQFFNFEQNYQISYIDELIPQYLRSVHTEYVNEFIERTTMSNKKLIHILAISNKQFIKQFNISITISDEFDQFILVALIQKVKSNKIHFIFDEFGVIQEITENFTYFNIIKEKSVYIQSLTQNIFPIILNSYYDEFFPCTFTERSNHQKIEEAIELLDNQLLSQLSYQQKVEKIILFYQVFNYTQEDRDFSFKGKLSKVTHKEKFIYYHLELLQIEGGSQAKIQIKEQKNEKELFLLDDSFSQEGSVMTDSSSKNIIHDLVHNKSMGWNLLQILRFSIYYVAGMLFGMTIIYFVLQLNHGIMIDYIKYLEAPFELNKVYQRSLSYGILSYFSKELNYSEYLQNQFKNENLKFRLLIQQNLNQLQNQFTQIDKQGYGINVQLISNNQSKTITKYSELLIDISENLFSLLDNSINSKYFINGSLFFFLNSVNISNFLNQLIDNLNDFIVDYINKIKLQWLLVTVCGIFGLIFPQLLYTYYWYRQEQQLFQYFQIQTRLTNEDIRMILGEKDTISNLIQDQEQSYFQRISSTPTIKRIKNINFRSGSQSRFTNPSSPSPSTRVTLFQNNRYIYDKIKKKKINLLPKILMGLLFYFVVFIVFIMGNQLFVINFDQYKPLQSFYIGFIKFHSDLDLLSSLALILKTKNAYIEELSKFNTLPIIDFTQYPETFKIVYARENWKPLASLQVITSLEVIDQQTRNVFYDLYRNSFCLHLFDKIPFCEQEKNAIIQKYGQFDEIDNNYFSIQNGILGLIGQFSLFLQTEYQIELEETTYTNNTQQTLKGQYFNNLIIQFHLNIISGLDYFLDIITPKLSQLVHHHQQRMQVYCIGAMGGYSIFFLILQLYLIKQDYNRLLKMRIALSIIPVEYLHDKHNMFQLKQLSQQ